MPKDRPITGADLFAAALQDAGVTTVFGYPGATALPLFDALYDTPIHLVVPRHEQGATFMAGGYARATGTPGVVLVTSGPGATNTVTAIADAYLDSIPLVIFTAQVARAAIGTDAFQESDITGITLPITKHSYLLKSATEIPQAIAEAFYLATTGRPGPVVIDIPLDVAEQLVTGEPCKERRTHPDLNETATIEPGEPCKERRTHPDATPPCHPERSAQRGVEGPQPSIHLKGYNPRPTVPAEAITQAAELLAAAQNPVLLAGGGVISANASEALTRLARIHNIPVATTLMGRGAFPEDDPLWIGMPGLFGTAAANKALRETDLLIAVGTRFAERVAADPATLATGGKIIHIDIDAAELGKQIRPTLALNADAKEVLEALLVESQQCVGDAYHASRKPLPTDGTPPTVILSERSTPPTVILSERNTPPTVILSERSESKDLSLPNSNTLTPRHIIKTLDALAQTREAAGQPTIRVTEVGQNQLWAAQYSTVTRPRSFLTSGGLGAMGFGLPAAIGAQIACPDALVINISGDGSFQMNVQELATAAQENLPIKVFILNNGTLGLVRQWQDLQFDGRHAASTLNPNLPDFVKLAQSYGILGLRATTEAAFDQSFKTALATDGPAVVDCRIPPDEQVDMSTHQLGEASDCVQSLTQFETGEQQPGESLDEVRSLARPEAGDLS